jgi:hypothetical protein
MEIHEKSYRSDCPTPLGCTGENYWREAETYRIRLGVGAY